MIFLNKHDGSRLEVPDENVTDCGSWWYINHDGEGLSETNLHTVDGWEELAFANYPPESGYIFFSSDAGHENELGYWDVDLGNVYMVRKDDTVPEAPARFTSWAYATITEGKRHYAIQEQE